MLHPVVCQSRRRTSSRAVCVSRDILYTMQNAHFRRRKQVRVLIFNITHGRSGTAFLNTMKTSIINQLQLSGRSEDVQSFFDHVIFCTNITYANGGYKSGMFPVNHSSSSYRRLDALDILTVNATDTTEVQQELASAWAARMPSFPSSNIHVEASIQQAVELVRDLEPKSNKHFNILVTGSLHLVGGLIEVASLGDVAL